MSPVIRVCAPILLSTALALALACGGEGPTAGTDSSALAAAGAGPSVNGSGHLPHPTLGTDRNFTVQARRDGSGDVRGSANLINHLEGVLSHSRTAVTCLVVEGHRARMGGVVLLDTDVPEIEGWDAFWTVEDNGEGGTAVAPDRISRVYVSANPGLAEAFCDGLLAFDPPLYDVDRGSVQVRP